MRNNHKEIKEFIVSQVIEMTQGCNYIVYYEEVEAEFENLSIEDMFIVNELLLDDFRVADSILNEDGFDVIIYKDYL
jgi:hypothetical protein